MKKLIILFFLALAVSSIDAQVYDVNLSATLKKSYDKLKKGSDIVISSVYRKVEKTFNDGLEDNFYLVVGKDSIEINSKVGDRFDFHCKNAQDLWDSEIISNVLVSLHKNGIQNALRIDMEQDALDFISRAKKYDQELNDPYLENYIYSIIAEIAPVNIIDGRPGNVNLLVLDDPMANACMYPNGTLIITSGLLSCLQSEDELAAVLSHEIAHFILDHSIANVNKAVKRQKRAEFWTALLTGVAAAGEVYAASKNNYYVPGAATLGVAVLSSTIAQEVNRRLGMEYNHEQELEADEMAKKVLEFLHYDKNALATAFSHMQQEYVKERSNAMYFASYTHPALVERIAKAGVPSKNVSVEYQKTVSFAVTSAALTQYVNRRFRNALRLVSRNVTNNVATATDYILMANCTLALYNTQQSNQDVVKYIGKAKAIQPTNINIYKAEILAKLRLKDKISAANLLKEYIGKLDEMEKDCADIRSSDSWNSQIKFIRGERTWASNMITKLKGM